MTFDARASLGMAGQEVLRPNRCLFCATVCTVPRARYQGSALDPPCGAFPCRGLPPAGSFSLTGGLYLCVCRVGTSGALNMYPALYFRIKSRCSRWYRRVDGRVIVCEHTNPPRRVYDLRKKTMKTLLWGGLRFKSHGLRVIVCRHTAVPGGFMLF